MTPINSKTSNNQRLKKWVRCVLLLYNWYFRLLWLTTYCRQGHNLVLLKFTTKKLEIDKRRK